MVLSPSWWSWRWRGDDDGFVHRFSAEMIFQCTHKQKTRTYAIRNAAFDKPVYSQVASCMVTNWNQHSWLGTAVCSLRSSFLTAVSFCVLKEKRSVLVGSGDVVSLKMGERRRWVRGVSARFTSRLLTVLFSLEAIPYKNTQIEVADGQRSCCRILKYSRLLRRIDS